VSENRPIYDFNDGIVHLNQRDVTMVCVSRAPLARLDAYKRRMGWSFPWASSGRNDFAKHQVTVR
jgi:predicted dithiol-disulfide oxidoreductase (DUF899 family)